MYIGHIYVLSLDVPFSSLHTDGQTMSYHVIVLYHYYMHYHCYNNIIVISLCANYNCEAVYGFVQVFKADEHKVVAYYIYDYR